MRVSAEAMDVYSRVNALWQDWNIPVNKFSMPYRKNPELWVDDVQLARRFMSECLEKHNLTPIAHWRTVSGNAHTWAQYDEGSINPQKGWFDLAHLTSHLIWARRRPVLQRKGWKVPKAHHCLDHAHLELWCSQKLLRMLPRG